MEMDAIDDDVLELILLRLGSQLCLIRAACTCKRWRRIIAGAAFLRRFISLLRRPPVDGFYYHKGGSCCWAPLLTSSPSCAAIDDGHFSLDFLQCPYDQIMDTCGSLLLIHRSRYFSNSSLSRRFIVCEPLTRRYRNIVLPRKFQSCNLDDAYILNEPDADANGTVYGDMIVVPNFRVLCLFNAGNNHCRAGVFTLGSDNGWHFSKIVTSDNAGDDDDNDFIPRLWKSKFLGRACGCLYWADSDGEGCVFNGSTGELSSFRLPDMEMFNTIMFNHMRYKSLSGGFRVVDGGGGGALLIVCVDGDDLHVFARRHGAGRWTLEKSIRLPEGMRQRLRENHIRSNMYYSYHLNIVAIEAKLVLLTIYPNSMLFQINIDTGEVKLYEDERCNVGFGNTLFPYKMPWPPVLHAYI